MRKPDHSMNERREPRLRASASKPLRSQSRRPTPATIPSRVSSDRATSTGDRIGSTTRVDHPTSSNTGFQKSKSRHIRGSLTTGRAASPNSEISVSAARARSSEATGSAMRRRSKRRQSAQWLPAASRISSFSAIMRGDSQNPRSLYGAGFMKWAGAPPPSRTSAPATLDVPLRCMPRTTIAETRGSRLHNEQAPRKR